MSIGAHRLTPTGARSSPFVRGWSIYYRHVVSKRTYQEAGRPICTHHA